MGKYKVKTCALMLITFITYWIFLITFSVYWLYINILLNKRNIEWVNVTNFKVHYFFILDKLFFHWNGLAREKNRLSIIYCDRYKRYVTAFCENCRLKLWGRPLAFTHITQSQPLRDCTSYSSLVVALWRIEGVARGINSRINYCEHLNARCSMYIICNAYIIPCHCYHARTTFSSIVTILHAECLGGRKKYIYGYKFHGDG